jgi:hypothetical protein
MPPRIQPATLSSQEAKTRLVEQLVGLIDRTFTEDGRGEGLRTLRDMLMNLERRDLRELVLQMGLEGAEELTEPEREDRSPRAE